jgi:hypothetical protein
VTVIKLKEKFRLNEENLKMDSFYRGGQDKKNVFYTFEAYLDNKINEEGKRFCYVQIQENREGKSSFTHMYQTKKDLARALAGYSCLPIELELTEI